MYTIIIIITMIMFMVLSLWPSQCESSPSSMMSARWLTTVKPSQTIWAVSQPEIHKPMHKIHKQTVSEVRNGYSSAVLHYTATVNTLILN